jgi:dTDP-4-amino-4,6-dideoxygalactose transaminase
VATPVPFVDLVAQYESIATEIDQAFHDVTASAQYILGDGVQRFEGEFARFVASEHAVGVGSGLDALRLGLLALEVGPGDEVIVPANTYIATALAVSEVGGDVVLVDCDAMTYNIDPQLVEAAVTARTKALLPVHFAGQAADMASLLELAGAHDLEVVEDAAQAHGTRYRDRPCGSIGKLACFSFYPGKNLGAFGDAGAVVTARPEVADRVRALANHGRSHGSSHYEHDFVGTNSRLDALQAIALAGKLARSEDWTERRIELAARYRRQLVGLNLGLTCLSPAARHVYHLFVVRVGRREEVRAELGARGIQTGVHYPVPCHLQPPLRRFADAPLPVAERSAGELLSLPLFPHMTDDQVDAVCEALGDVLPAKAAGTELVDA